MASSCPGATFLKAARSGELELFKKMEAKLGDGGEGTFAKIKGLRGVNALHLAAAAGHTHICEYLIKQLKFDVDVQDEFGETPLHHATREQRQQTALHLVENGASISKTDHTGLTPLHCAAARGKELLELFISRGADIEANSALGTPLTHASSEGNREAVAFLLQNNADPNPVNSFGTPIILSSASSLACTELLVKAGADPNIYFCGVTPLHGTINGEKVEITTYLLKAGANPDGVDISGMTPLERAVAHGKLKAASILFPVTSPIPSVADWSFRGLMRYLNSVDFQKKMAVMKARAVDVAKSKGNDAFKRGAHWEAINWYTTIIGSYVPLDAQLFCISNRSLCYARLNMGRPALLDAKGCVRLRPEWPKTHYREGVAWKMLKNYDEAANCFSRALKLDSNKKEVEKALQEAVEARAEAMGK